MPLIPNKYRIDGDIAYIELTDKNGNVVGETIISISDLPRVSLYRWHAAANARKGSFRVSTTHRENGTERHLALHRLILDAPAGVQVDHINRNQLDNRRENLRFVTASQNMQNQVAHTNSSTGVKNVHWYENLQRYRVKVTRDNKTYWLGNYRTLEEAAEVARQARLNYHTHSPEQSAISHPKAAFS